MNIITIDKIKVNQTHFFILCIFSIIINPIVGLLISCLISPLLDDGFRLFLSIICLIITILFFSVVEPFSDLSEYLLVYNDINNIDIFDYKRFGYGLEIFILLIMKVINNIFNGNEFSFLFFTYTIMQLLVLMLCHKINRRFYLLLFGVVFFNFGYIQTTSYNLRQFFSVVFFIYIFLSNKLYLRIIFSFLSIISHISGLINITLYWIGKRKYIAFFISIILLLLFFSENIDKNIILYASSKFLENNDFKPLKLTEIIIHNLEIIPLLLFIFFNRNKYLQTRDEKILFVIYFINLLVYWYFIDEPSIPNRLSYLIIAFPIFSMFFYIKNNTVEDIIKYKVLSAIIIINFIFFLYLSYNIENYNNNFNFFGSKPITSNLFDVINILYDKISLPFKYKDLGN